MFLLLVIGTPGLLLVIQEGADTKALGLLWSAVFGLFAAAIHSRGSQREPVVTVSAEGIRDRRISAECLTWDSMARVEGFEAENVAFVGIDFHDANAALAHARPLVRLFAAIHRIFGFPAVSINTSLLDGSDEDVIMAIEHFRPALLCHG